MRLIVAELNAYSHYVSREFAYIIRELIHAHGWQHLDRSAFSPGRMRETIVRHCGELPEIVLFWGGEDFLGDHEREVEKLNTAKWFVDRAGFTDCLVFQYAVAKHLINELPTLKRSANLPSHLLHGTPEADSLRSVYSGEKNNCVKRDRRDPSGS